MGFMKLWINIQRKKFRQSIAYMPFLLAEYQRLQIIHHFRRHIVAVGGDPLLGDTLHQVGNFINFTAIVLNRVGLV